MARIKSTHTISISDENLEGFSYRLQHITSDVPNNLDAAGIIPHLMHISEQVKTPLDLVSISTNGSFEYFVTDEDHSDKIMILFSVSKKQHTSPYTYYSIKFGDQSFEYKYEDHKDPFRTELEQLAA